jgi:uncharacterized repeat protein (TIGR01451 family)
MRYGVRLSLILLMALAFGLPAAQRAGAQPTSADLQTVKSDSPDSVPPGGTITYDIILTNAGPDTADFASLEDTLPDGTTFVSFVPADAAWICTTPAVGSGGTVSCSIDSLAVGSAAFTLIVAVDAGVTPGTVITNTASAGSETSDPDPGNNDGSADTTVAVPPPTAEVSVTKVDDPDPVTAGSNLVYTITVNSSGSADATNVNLVDPLPPETTFVSLSSPGGWSCITPAVGTNDAVLCSISSLGPGSAVFTLTVAVGAGVNPGTQIFNTATVSAENDLEETNNNGSATTTVGGDATSVSLTKSAFPFPVVAGTGLTYFVTAINPSGINLGSATITDTLPAGTTFDSFANPEPAGWTCTTPPVGATGTITCSAAPFAPGTANIGFNVTVDASLPAGTVLTNTAHLVVTDGTAVVTRDATTTTEVITPPAISATKAVSGSFMPGGSVTYTVVLTNLGPGNQGDNPGPEFTDVLPTELTLVSAMATSGTATATVGTNTVTWNGSLAGGGGSVTITINATIDAGVPPGTTISNQGRVFFDFDGDGINESSTVTDDPATEGPDPTSLRDSTAFLVVEQQSIVEVPALDGLGLALLAALLTLAGTFMLRQRKA